MICLYQLFRRAETLPLDTIRSVLTVETLFDTLFFVMSIKCVFKGIP
jgi:hypothetical protein